MTQLPCVLRKMLACAVVASAVVLVVFTAGCPQAGQNTASSGQIAGGGSTPIVSYNLDIQPIFDANCVSCHAAGPTGVVSGAGLDLTPGNSYFNLFNQPSQEFPGFLLVEPGSASTSWLYIKVSQEPPVGLRMPPFSGPLPDSDIQLIRTWIKQGGLSD